MINQDTTQEPQAPLQEPSEDKLNKKELGYFLHLLYKEGENNNRHRKAYTPEQMKRIIKYQKKVTNLWINYNNQEDLLNDDDTTQEPQKIKTICNKCETEKICINQSWNELICEECFNKYYLEDNK